MSHFQAVSLEHASRLINHGPTILVTSRSRDGSKNNVMAAAWSMPVEFTPPRIAVVIDKRTFSRELIESSGVFGICIPGAGAADMTYAVGSVSGREIDKFAQYHIPALTGSVLGLPLIEQGCVAWLECRLIPELHTQDAYDTCFGEVVAAAADSRVFHQGRWGFSAAHPDLHTIHHLGAGAFVRAGAVIQARLPE
jgi:flavin reductase (DIM6/NTAB) family NADH-FMN oxidoreductase RutF